MADTPNFTHANRMRPYFEQQPTQPRAVNVSDPERLASALGGAALLGFGLSRGTLGGLALAALGTAVLYRGATGHCPCYAALGISTTDQLATMTSVEAHHGVKV